MAKSKNAGNSFFTGMDSFEEHTEKASAPQTEDKEPVTEETIDVKPQDAPVRVKKKRERKTVRVPLLVTPSVANGMRAIADREDRSVNDIVNELMKEYVNKNL